MKSLLLAALILSSGANKEPTLPADALAALDQAEHATLYSLEPRDPVTADAPVLHRWKVLGQTRISGEPLRAARGAYRSAMVPGDFGFACFDPRHAIRIEDGGHVYDFLLCFACYRMSLYKDGKPVASVGVHGSPKLINDVLVAAGLPRSTSEDEVAFFEEQQKGQIEMERFEAAMPRSVGNIMAESFTEYSADRLRRTQAALAQEYPRPKQRILALFHWLGSAPERKNGRDEHERFIEDLLMAYTTEELLAPLRTTDPSDTQLAGAARLLAGIRFTNKRPGDWDRISASLKSSLSRFATPREGAANGVNAWKKLIESP